jgi:hypothetical protein
MEHSVHIVDGISMEDGKPQKPPSTASLMEELLRRVDHEERERLLREAIEEKGDA